MTSNHGESDEDKSNTKKTPRSFWDLAMENPEAATKFIKALLDGFQPYADKFLEDRKGNQEHEIKMERTVSRFAAIILTIALIGTFGFGLLIGILVYYHSVSADSLLFYIGVVMGFLLSLIRKQMPGFGDNKDDEAP